MQSSEKKEQKTVKDYSEFIETIARIEYARLGKSSHLIEFADLVNIGAVAIHVLLKTQNSPSYNKAYLSTAIKWAIRNELRQRYKWYSNKQYAKELFNDDLKNYNKEEIREAVYETILSIDGIDENDSPMQIQDMASNPEDKIVFKELSLAIKESMKNLPKREQEILQKRFFEGKKVKELASELNITSSRISRIIQTGLDRIKKELKEQRLIES